MHDEPLYARPDIRVEGLINRFCAWLHVFAPVPAAMNLANLHLPMLDSFVEQPQVHADAVANPQMKGGFFINVDVARHGEIRELRDRIRKENELAERFAKAVADAEDMLRAQATGYDLSPLYAQLPDELRGTVELVYDTDNHAQLRFMEALLYKSDLYRPDLQALDLSLDDGTEPPFALATPRLPEPGHLQVPTPLRERGVDTLFAARNRPKRLSEIADALGVEDAAGLQTLRGLLSTEPTLRPDRTIDGGGRIRYFGHACVLLQSPTVSVLTDPFISSHTAAGDGRFTYDDLPDRIDYVVISHGHQDHVVPETLLRIRERVGTVIVPRNGGGNREDPSIRLFLEHLGFDVREADSFDEVPFDGGSIVATPFLGEHCDLDIRAKSTYVVRIAGKSVFIGADSSGLDAQLYARIRRALGPVDIGFLGMECDGAPLSWLYKALFTQPVSRKMSITRKLSGSNAAQAVDIVRELGIQQAFIYAMGQEEWLQHIMATSYTPESYQLQQVAEFLAACAERGVEATHLLVRGETRW
ncbi:MBL fold metallo-hydrolase [Catenulispora sp. NF23]|uniref:MBL fold metallo-hydrolase n=1 Tax=Catenulispora pinistramenti TaxID=2705254 RepID=A0ABS5KM74_9ACTN|nr:MBL fold metallo-hydrolase [Catenulispora pinistramenti]MBS2532114.1 MBL fold metallo-hydrolase [Catenulispora pinistramenti]MBS2547156.1 MBL fold metallo-hydrolase [Catenulispora pinistramenti]